MPAKVVRLRTRGDQLSADKAAQLRQLLLDLSGLPERAVGEIVRSIDRSTAAENGWSFVMLSPAQNLAVVKWLAQNSQRPQAAVLLWAELFVHLRRDTGEIMQTRDELADAVGLRSEHVSAIMTELENIGAISRKRTKVPGMRGPGMVRYFMSPRVGTHLAGKARDDAQADAPLLRLME